MSNNYLHTYNIHLDSHLCLEYAHLSLEYTHLCFESYYLTFSINPKMGCLLLDIRALNRSFTCERSFFFLVLLVNPVKENINDYYHKDRLLYF